MPTYVTVRRNLVVPALLEIEDSEFAHWYSLGVYWAMFGDSQARGPYHDTYLIDTISSGIAQAWYNDRNSGWFPMMGFKLGMIHGGWLSKPSATLVVLTEPDFTKGYHVGRDYCFTEAIQEGRVLTDRLFNDAVYEWACGYASWQEPHETFCYVLGCRIGELSGAIMPLTPSELTLDGAVNTAVAVRLLH
jgi:hypothetical protein